MTKAKSELTPGEPTPYPEVPAQPRYPELEERVLASWDRADTFARSVALRPRGEHEFVFYDGPPFANGLPHYGHLLTGYVKDVVPRYQTMRGRRVERRFGWDCHGLPAEMGAEKELGISGRKAIAEYGIERFNAHCRASVMKYTQEWERYVRRQARWVDFRNDYKTMDLSYMESVLWAFSELWKKGLVYESYRVMPYSWAAETPVSNFETRLDDSYRDRTDPAVTVRFELEPAPGPGAFGRPLEALVWTTTPWTLPSNLALAVGAAIEYAVFEQDGRRRILGAAAAAKYERELAGWTRVATVRGAELVGRRYRPLFPFFAGHANAFRVLSGEFVSTDEGTGIVHMAPGFGEDDQVLCAANGIELVCPVDGSGRFMAEVPPWQGMNVLEANKPIIAELKLRGALLRHDTIVHSYPHCWRTDQPLIYRAVNSWYVKVTAFRERMVELNRSIRWIPEHVRDGQFGKWLEGARDWSISRNRFWGSPLPVWRSDDPRYPRTDVYGSLAELERDFGVRLTDLHRPAVDALTRPNPDDPSGKSTMRRVEDVFDCWFESGSMPFAQIHYPFENKAWFESHFPADFIVEYIAQTRGWFYTLVVLSTALFDKAPFQNCICHGVVLDPSGRKLSKRLSNYPEPEEMFATHGADALRWFLCSSPVLRGADLEIEKDGKQIGEVVRLVLNPIWNAYAFFTLYANTDRVRGRLRTDASGVLDRYVLAKTGLLVGTVQAALDAYEIAGACAEVRTFLDALNNWYIRRSRVRFWKGELDDDKRAAFDTLYTVLVTLCKVAAPLLPYLTEEIYRNLTGEESVHLADWPDARAFPAAPELVADMDVEREVCSTALALREKHRLRTRLPLQQLIVASHREAVLRIEKRGSERIRDEVNVKEVRFVPAMHEYGWFEIRPNARRIGPRHPSKMKEILAETRRRNEEHSRSWWPNQDGTLVVAGVTLDREDYETTFRADSSRQNLVAQSLDDDSAVVLLDVTLTRDLQLEGLARDAVRLIQTARKEAGLHVSDRIELVIDATGETAAAIEAHRTYVMQETLATALTLGEAAPGMHLHRGVVGEGEVALGLRATSRAAASRA
jgi:isoleucyl-tRNA synthetase